MDKQTFRNRAAPRLRLWRGRTAVRWRYRRPESPRAAQPGGIASAPKVARWQRHARGAIGARQASSRSQGVAWRAEHARYPLACADAIGGPALDEGPAFVRCSYRRRGAHGFGAKLRERWRRRASSAMRLGRRSRSRTPRSRFSWQGARGLCSAVQGPPGRARRVRAFDAPPNFVHKLSGDGSHQPRPRDGVRACARYTAGRRPERRRGAPRREVGRGTLAP